MKVERTFVIEEEDDTKRPNIEMYSASGVVEETFDEIQEEIVVVVVVSFFM